MDFFNEAVKVLEIFVEALTGRTSYRPMDACADCLTAPKLICPELTKKAVRVRKHLRPPIRAEPEKALYHNINRN